jgi:hypothetical protein
MSALISRNVDDLAPASRENLEQLLGAPLEAHQRVYIVVDAPPPGPTETTRLHAAERIRQIITQAQAHADSQGVPEAELDEAVDEALTAIRPRA